jgi:hypothetical protein
MGLAMIHIVSMIVSIFVMIQNVMEKIGICVIHVKRFMKEKDRMMEKIILVLLGALAGIALLIFLIPLLNYLFPICGKKKWVWIWDVMNPKRISGTSKQKEE